MLDEEGLPNKAVPLFCMEIPYCHTVIFALFCPRGFAIPELVTADILSARVTDPLLSTLWIANPQGRMLFPMIFPLIFFRPLAKKREEN